MIIATCSSCFSRYEDARKYVDEEFGILNEIGASKHAGNVAVNRELLAELCEKEDNLAEATKHLKAALKHRTAIQKNDDTDGVAAAKAYTLYELGRVYNEQEQWAKARKRLLAALAIRRDRHRGGEDVDRSDALTLHELGRACLELGMSRRTLALAVTFQVSRCRKHDNFCC